MIRRLYLMEFERMVSDARVRWMGSVFLLLFATVFVTEWHSASRVAADRAAVTAAERQRWLNQDEKDPHEAAHYGVWAIKPSSPLSVLDPGVEPFSGLAVWLEAHQWDEMIFRPRQDANPLMRGAISVAQLVSVLGPLAACVLAFAAFAEDRERGTLRLALGNGGSPGALLIARGLAMMTVLAAMVIVPAALGGGVAGGTMPDAGWNTPARLSGWIAAHVVYLATFLMLGLAVSLRAATARAALIALVSIWVVFCLVVPRVATNLAEAGSPLPSYQDVRARAETEAPVYESFDQWEARRQSILAKWRAATDDDVPVNMRGAQLDQAERHSHEVFDRLIGSFHDQVETQDCLFGRLGLLSPAVALQSAATAIAGTDFHQHRHFVNAAESYRRRLVNRINGEVMRHDVAPGERYVEGATFWANTPEFVYQPPPLGSVLAAVAAPLLLLVGWCAAATLAAGAALRGLRA
jgi:ABC-2 type transport system permease protein